MKNRRSLIGMTILLALGAAVLLLGGAAWLAGQSVFPALAAPQAPDEAVTVWTSRAVVAHRTPGGLMARSLVTLPDGRWYFALGGDQVVLAAESDPALYVDGEVLQAEAVQVAVYPDGQAALVYLDRRPGEQVLSVARPTASGYRRESLVSAGGLSSPSLVVDSRGWLHLTYIDQGELLYLYRDLVGWHGPQLVVAASGPQSLAVDSTNRLHLAYLASGVVYYLYSTPTGWSTPTQVSSGFASAPQLLIDADDQLHMIYGGGTPGMQYAVLEPGGWLTETIDTADYGVGNTAALVLDPSGSPNVGYVADVCGGCYDLRYAYRDTSGWQKESLAGSDERIDTALALDGSGNPQLVYTIAAGLHTAMKTGSGWLYDDGAFHYSSPIEDMDFGRNPALAVPALDAGRGSLAYLRPGSAQQWLDIRIAH